MNGLPSRSLSYDFQHLVVDDLPAIDTFAPAEVYKKSLDVSIVAQQQAIADIFFQLKLIPKKVTIAGGGAFTRAKHKHRRRNLRHPTLREGVGTFSLDGARDGNRFAKPISAMLIRTLLSLAQDWCPNSSRVRRSAYC